MKLQAVNYKSRPKQVVYCVPFIISRYRERISLPKEPLLPLALCFMGEDLEQQPYYTMTAVGGKKMNTNPTGNTKSPQI